ncbi:uncharacterized protein PV09_09709 [Verruconis gallopava]|uniref:Secreted protein n=1 Tax=Verruconis gallopava TaxID=253628 RepID=A0A0D1ZVJ7_9PEZI|nr:uncharacterized protein PV09_09709 [Verruconis gallopava]KIV98482.1 hypothetical protein PV09_09709 [Verruconis gallopava]
MSARRARASGEPLCLALWRLLLLARVAAREGLLESDERGKIDKDLPPLPKDVAVDVRNGKKEEGDPSGPNRSQQQAPQNRRAAFADVPVAAAVVCSTAAQAVNDSSRTSRS